MFKIKGSGLSFSHPLALDKSIPQDGLPEPRLLELTQRLRDGTITKLERDELAKSYIHLALAIAGRYAIPRKIDEYISCALFGIVKALNEANAKMIDDNLDAWVASCIHSMCRRFFYGDHAIRVPQSTNATRKSLGKEPHPFKSVISFSDFPASENSSPDDFLCEHCKDIIIEELDGTEMRELLSMSAADEIDERIIKLRMESCTDQEVAEKLGYSVDFINKRRHRIARRLQRLTQD